MLLKYITLIHEESLLGSATASASSKDVTITIKQLGSSTGNIYISITGTGKLESDRTKVDYQAEVKSNTVDINNIVVYNNAGSSDSVQVSGLSEGDVIKIYSAATGRSLLGSATVATYNRAVTITITQLGAASGNMYVSVLSTNKLESDRVEVNYPAEQKTDNPSADNITVANNAGIASTVTVKGLTGNDVVKVYDSASGGTQLGTATVSTYDDEVTVSISQLSSSAGSLYVSVTSKNKLESNRTKIDFAAKPVSDSINPTNVTVTNNAGIQDTIEVNGLETSDIIKVCNTETAGALIGSATVPSGSMKANLTITQLGSSSGSAYLTLTRSGKTESFRTEASYTAESTAPVAANIIIINNAGTADTITVTGLTTNDLVMVYDSASGGNLLGSATVAANSNEAAISITQLTTGSGSVYVTVTSFGRSESIRTKVDYASEASSNAPYIGNKEIRNNAGISDTITVSNLKPGDVIKVYDSYSGGSLLGYATVSSSKTEATISITELGDGAGSVYISVTSIGKTESARTEANYVSEISSEAPYIGNIIVVNNSGKADTITITGLNASDTVKVYDAAEGGNLIGTFCIGIKD